ncbi:G-type lectin S-receptor-like serine/threonine-protein kinase At4g27290 isoform X2 [Vicia villosa]|uniref:G-type lectin S-receptor-like serine/threonine-protein kinase At4g27290 isoform X2 n=1 Tax=Vicia villosa TaxID=3911 RepID=UPI00273CDD42|nr:G-type lectin S-receptor-like serine/threonine-protein kinase At4g27290 isoform X2 [Vicia villosa]
MNHTKMTIFPAMVIVSMLLLLFSKFSYGADTITQSESLSDGSTLISKEGTFELGFFNPGNSPNRYVGIWYKNIPVKTVVWVANRDNPIKDNSSKLMIDKQGNLVLLNSNQSLIWSTNTTKKASTPIVQLLDNGNLVIRDENDTETDEESFLWQSFDYPTDTLLPEMKLGWDKKTGIHRIFTAWKNWEDPSSGDFVSSMSLSDNPEDVLWKGSTEFYRTGPMIGTTDSGAYGMKANPIFNSEVVSNEDEAYFSYTLKNKSVISIVVLNQTSLLLQRLVWIPQSRKWSNYLNLPHDTCDGYNVCGPYGKCVIDSSPLCQCLDGFKPKSPQQWSTMNWADGCVRNGNWSCGVKGRDGFFKVTGVKFPDTTNTWASANMTLDDCKLKCLQNCSCTAYSGLTSNEDSGGCSMWFNDLKDLRDSDSMRNLYVRIDASNIGAKHGYPKLAILVVSIIVFAVIVMLLTLYIYRKKIKYKDNNEDDRNDLDLPFFDLATIHKATDYFADDNKLGEGGFGPVYKGKLQDGQEIAVKRLSRSSGQGLKEFKNEVILCSKLQHRNLVKIIGYCIEKDEKMLVYEYMPNTSLDSFIFDPIQSKLLDWSMRFNILFGIARGLLYLHQDSRLRIVHRDLKASNILLDNDMQPKISDFGLAKMCGDDQMEGETSRIVGTYGYMAPEYAIDGLFSIKSDVFSFGVLLLELISGKKNRTLNYSQDDHNLIGHAWRLWKEGTIHTLIDDNLKDTCILYEALRCIQIGLLCLQHHPDNRPSMTSVVVMLNGNNILPLPHEPSYLLKTITSEGETSSERQRSSSINNVTISQLNAR